MKTVPQAILLSILLTACNNLQNVGEAAYDTATSASFAVADAKSTVVDSKPEEPSIKGVDVSSVQTKIIKSASISFQVKDMNESHSRILKLLKQQQAYCISDNKSCDSYQLNAHFEIRVPADSFEILCNSLMQESIFTNYKNLSQQDVTEEYVDVAARLKSKKAVEEQYIELLKKAQKVSDILEIENSLRVIREEIEATEARLRVLDNRVALSTINLHIYQRLDYVAQPEAGFGPMIKESLIRGWQNLVGFIILLVRQWPFWLAQVRSSVSFF